MLVERGNKYSTISSLCIEASNLIIQHAAGPDRAARRRLNVVRCAPSRWQRPFPDDADRWIEHPDAIAGIEFKSVPSLWLLGLENRNWNFLHPPALCPSRPQIDYRNRSTKLLSVSIITSCGCAALRARRRLEPIFGRLRSTERDARKTFDPGAWHAMRKKTCLYSDASCAAAKIRRNGLHTHFVRSIIRWSSPGRLVSPRRSTIAWCDSRPC